MENKKLFETEEQNISPRNRKRKKEPKFQEYCRQRLREGNPITANEINDMFKEVFKDIFKSMFKAENYRNGSYKKTLKSDIACGFCVG